MSATKPLSAAEQMRDAAARACAVRQSAELIMRDDMRNALNGEMALAHGDRANAFHEAENAIRALPIPADPPDPVRAALVEACQSALASFEAAIPTGSDPANEPVVSTLGKRIGYGALMATASYLWREELKSEGYPVGGEFIAGPCRVTAEANVRELRAALDAAGEAP